MRKIKIQSILVAVAGLFLATSCSSSFLDTDPTDAVSSDKVSVPENAEALVMVPGIICSIIQVPMPILVIGHFSVWMI